MSDDQLHFSKVAEHNLERSRTQGLLRSLGTKVQTAYQSPVAKSLRSGVKQLHKTVANFQGQTEDRLRSMLVHNGLMHPLEVGKIKLAVDDNFDYGDNNGPNIRVNSGVYMDGRDVFIVSMDTAAANAIQSGSVYNPPREEFYKLYDEFQPLLSEPRRAVSYRYKGYAFFYRNKYYKLPTHIKDILDSAYLGIDRYGYESLTGKPVIQYLAALRQLAINEYHNEDDYENRDFLSYNETFTTPDLKDVRASHWHPGKDSEAWSGASSDSAERDEEYVNSNVVLCSKLRQQAIDRHGNSNIKSLENFFRVSYNRLINGSGKYDIDLDAFDSVAAYWVLCVERENRGRNKYLVWQDLDSSSRSQLDRFAKSYGFRCDVKFAIESDKKSVSIDKAHHIELEMPDYTCRNITVVIPAKSYQKYKRRLLESEDFQAALIRDIKRKILDHKAETATRTGKAVEKWEIKKVIGNALSVMTSLNEDKKPEPSS